MSTTTGTVLDTRTISTFHAGVYLQWTISGDVVFTVTLSSGANAVLNGLFFDAGPSMAPAPASVSTASVLTASLSAGSPAPASLSPASVPAVSVVHGPGAGTAAVVVAGDPLVDAIGAPDVGDDAPTAPAAAGDGGPDATREWVHDAAPAQVAPRIRSDTSRSATAARGQGRRPHDRLDEGLAGEVTE